MELGRRSSSCKYFQGRFSTLRILDFGKADTRTDRSSNVFRRETNQEPDQQKSEKSHSCGDLHSHGLAWLSGKCGKLRYWVTLDDGSGWFQAVGRELCRRGHGGVCILSWGSRDSLWQDLCFIFLWSIGGWDGACVEVTMCEIILSRCIYTYSLDCKRREDHYIWQQTCLDMCARVWSIHSFLFSCAHVDVSRHACVFFFGNVAAPDLRLLEDDYGPRRFPRSHSHYVDRDEVVTHGSCWVALPPAAGTDKLKNHESMQAFHSLISFNGGDVS